MRKLDPYFVRGARTFEMSRGLARATKIALAATSLASLAVACASRSTDTTAAPDLLESVGGDAALAPVTTSDAGSVASTPAADASPSSLCVLSGPPKSAPGEVLVFADEFDGPAIDATKWNVETVPMGHGTILNSSSADKVQTHDGLLSIVSDKSGAGAVLPYDSGFIDTVGRFARTYGRIEFRARFPYAVGVWYAIWATPWSQPFPEIDMELTNLGASQIWFVNHFASPPLPAAERRAYFVEPVDVKNPKGAVDLSQFHTYSLLWTPGNFTLSIDGDVKMQRTGLGVPDLPLLWRINAWVGGWGGSPTDATTFPVTFDVDYVHIFRVDGLIADPQAMIMNKKTAYARSDNIQVAVANFDEACVHVDMFDGTTRVQTAAGSPLVFSLSGLAPGPHALSFVATDGVRSTVASVTATID